MIMKKPDEYANEVNALSDESFEATYFGDEETVARCNESIKKLMKEICGRGKKFVEAFCTAQTRDRLERDGDADEEDDLPF